MTTTEYHGHMIAGSQPPSNSIINGEHESKIANCVHMMSHLTTRMTSLTTKWKMTPHVLCGHVIFHLMTVALSDGVDNPN